MRCSLCADRTKVTCLVVCNDKNYYKYHQCGAWTTNFWFLTSCSKFIFNCMRPPFFNLFIFKVHVHSDLIWYYLINKPLREGANQLLHHTYTMALEAVMDQVGGFGPYQRRVCFLLFLVAIPGAWHGIGSVFLLATTDHWCSVSSNVPGVNCTELSLSDAQCTELKKNLTIPYELKDSKLVYEQCLQYEDSFRRGSDDDSYSLWRNSSNRGTKDCAGEWDHDHSQYVSTASQEVGILHEF